MKVVKCYIWSMALYGAETWTLRAADQKYLERFEMWCWRRIPHRICFARHLASSLVLQFVITKRLQLITSSLWRPQRSSSCSHHICNNVTRFRNLNATDTHTNNMTMLQVWISESFPCRNPRILLLILPYCLCVSTHFIC